MAIELVNGYVCRNCTDVEYAKRGVDPADPKGTDQTGRTHRGRHGHHAAAATDTQQATDPITAPDDATTTDDVNRPLPGGDRGTLVNLVA
jgi:hypothetical protein